MADSGQTRFSRGDVVSRRYEIERELGTGLLGTTYLARHISSGRLLALKVLRTMLVANPRDRQRFEDAFARIKEHAVEGVVALGEVGEHGDQVYFTQDYFESQNLRQLIDEYQTNQESFSLEEACQIVLQVLETLDGLHRAGLQHRNLKPENVLVHTRRTGPGGKNIVRSVRISDAGLADIVNPTIFAESYISRSEAKYLAPELSGFDQDGTGRADVYSAGVILYELLVGQPPRGTYLSPTQLRDDLPDHADDVVEVALSESPEDRYPTARDMVNDIQRLFTSAPDQGPTGPNVRNLLIAVGGAVAVLGVLGVVIATQEKVDPVQEAMAKDDSIRKTVQAQNPAPSDAELAAMAERHPEMLYVPPGSYVSGRLHREDVKKEARESEPLAKPTKVGGFFIDRYEFPNRLQDASGSPNRPTVNYTWAQASDACAELGKRLCSAQEWEKACKGPGNYVYAYGDEFDGAACGADMGSSYNLGDLSGCQSKYGVLGLSGGPREWTSSEAAGKGSLRVVKGGLRGNAERGSRCAFEGDERETYADPRLAFRCCVDASAAATAPAKTEAPAAE